MGNLLRALSRLDGAGDWCAGGAAMRGAKLEADVFVDFEDARPESEDDEAVYERAEEVIRTADDVLAALRQYKGEVYAEWKWFGKMSKSLAEF